MGGGLAKVYHLFGWMFSANDKTRWLLHGRARYGDALEMTRVGLHKMTETDSVPAGTGCYQSSGAAWYLVVAILGSDTWDAFCSKRLAVLGAAIELCAELTL